VVAGCAIAKLYRPCKAPDDFFFARNQFLRRVGDFFLEPRRLARDFEMGLTQLSP
jgi:hypothetical protein